MKRVFLGLVSLIPVIFLSGPIDAKPDMPTDDKVLIQTGHSIQEELPAHFRILVWNIHKAEDGLAWQRDFHQLALQNDVLLLQEGYQIETYKQVTTQLPDMLWSFVTSFIYRGFGTGVVTGSSTKPIKTEWLRSPGREPFIASPKMTIISEFDLPQTDENLLIANIHGINFVTNGTFYEHISQVIGTIAKHKGPLIFAGDFNTWNSARMEFLKTRCQNLGLTMVTFSTDPRNRPIDHVFYRGLNAMKSEVLASINTSDHLPLSVEFSIRNPKPISTVSLTH